jgi:hypothetical protein
MCVRVSGQKLRAGQVIAAYRQESAQQYQPHHSGATALQRRHARQDGLVVRVRQLEPLGERHTLLVTGWMASRQPAPGFGFLAAQVSCLPLSFIDSFVCRRLAPRNERVLLLPLYYLFSFSCRVFLSPPRGAVLSHFIVLWVGVCGFVTMSAACDCRA